MKIIKEIVEAIHEELEGAEDYAKKATQYSMERGLMEIKETSVSHADGHVSVTKTPKITGKGQLYFINRLIK